MYAQTNPNAAKPRHDVTAFLIERGMEGFTSSPKLDKLGIRGSGTCELVFDNCKVPEENVLGAINKGIYVLFSGLDLGWLVLTGGWFYMSILKLPSDRLFTLFSLFLLDLKSVQFRNV